MRVGQRTWRGGRMVMTWQKLPHFLESCYWESCPANRGSCKHSAHKFSKGETRLALVCGESKTYVNLDSSAIVMRAAMAAVPSFKVDTIQGFTDLPSAHKLQILKAFKQQASLQKKLQLQIQAEAKAEAKAEAEAEAKAEAEAEAEAQAQAEAQAEAEAEVKVEASSAAKSEPQAQAQAQRLLTKRRGTKRSEPAEAVGDVSISEYEKQRDENIRHNRSILEQLNLLGVAQEMRASAAPSVAPQPRGLAMKRERREVAVERRSSLRQQGRTADGDMSKGVDREGRDGSITLVSGASVQTGTYREWEQPKQVPHHPLPFESLNSNEPQEDVTFLAALQHCTSLPRSRPKAAASVAAISSLSLTASGVAKVTPTSTIHLQFLPSSDSLVLAAGDKQGHLGLWNLGGQEGCAHDGVRLFKPHTQYMSSLLWGQDKRLYSASYDGAVRCLDVASGSFLEVFWSEDIEISAFSITGDARGGYAAGNGGEFVSVDMRTASPTHKPVSLHNRKINTLHLDPISEQLLSSSCSDGTVSVWDVRTLGPKCKALHTLSHPKSSQAAVFAPDGSQRLATISYDDTIRVWSNLQASKPTEDVRIRHNNNTGRWIAPFRPVWGPNSDSLLVGSMSRGLDVFDVSSGKLSVCYRGQGAPGEDPLLTAIPARVAAHPSLPVIACGTASGRLCVFQ